MISGLLSRIKHQLKLALYRMQGKKFVHFLHIGKTGGSAIKHALRQYTAANRYVLFLHSHSIGLTNISRGASIMFVVRDPISRFVSGFYSRQRQGQPMLFVPWSAEEKLAFENFSTPNQLAIALSSPDMEERNKAHEAMAHIGHVKSSYWDWFKDEEYFRSRLPDILFIGFQERLTEDFEIIKSKLGIPANASLPTDDIQAHRNPDDLDRTLTDEAYHNIKKWYKKDFEFIALCREIINEHSELNFHQ